MNEKFFGLPEEKQLKIINAAFEVFSVNDYKHASTDDIAAKAGISKGLLFYYFHNKKSLYMYLFEYSKEITLQQIMDEKLATIDDFFELMDYGSYQKTEVFAKTPYIMEFVIRAFFSENEIVSPELQKYIQESMASTYQSYFGNINLSKFKDDVEPMKILNMLTWMTEGYLYNMRQQGRSLELQELMKEFRSWSDMFKKIAYKEEYLDECH